MEPRDLDAAATAIVARRLPAHGAIGGNHDVNAQRDVKFSIIAARKASAQVGSGRALRPPRPPRGLALSPPAASPLPPVLFPATPPGLGKSLLVHEHHIGEPHGLVGDAEGIDVFVLGGVPAQPVVVPLLGKPRRRGCQGLQAGGNTEGPREAR